MNEVNNESRAQWAEATLSAFSQITEGYPELYDEPDAVLTDLLCNLMHYCQQSGADFEGCALSAEISFNAELESL